MSEERSIELGVACLDAAITELSEVLDLAEHWWPEEEANALSELAEAAVRWALARGYATLDAGNFSEPAAVPPGQIDAVLADRQNWVEALDMRMFLRRTKAGAAVYADRARWPAGYRERIERIEERNAAIDPARLAAELAVRLAPLAPEGYRVESRGPILDVMRGPYGMYCDLEESIHWQPENEFAVENVLRNLFDQVQQEFTEAQALPWPTNTPSYRGRVFADPEVDRDDTEIRMWFGPKDEPAFTIDPIPLADVTR